MAKNRKIKTSSTKAVDRSSYKKTADGKVIKPVKYMGKLVGHGNYMAGSVDGELIVDNNGKPIPYKAI